jgi:hypothetical protein
MGVADDQAFESQVLQPPRDRLCRSHPQSLNSVCLDDWLELIDDPSSDVPAYLRGQHSGKRPSQLQIVSFGVASNMQQQTRQVNANVAGM